MVEFALVLPLLLILLLGIADFGRVFSAGITIEAAARNAAEIGAVERLRNKPPDPVAAPAAFARYYSDLHQLIARVACSEARLLPNNTFLSDRTCPDTSEGTGMPVIRVCLHDAVAITPGSGDPACGAAIAGFGPSIPPECSHMAQGWNNTSGGAAASHSVEVRVCYHFTTLFNLRIALPFESGLNLGDVWLQRERVFVVDCPPGDVSTC